MLFKPLLTRSGSAEKPGKLGWKLTWKSRRSELEMLARRGERKAARARRVPCIHDTTLVRGWHPASVTSHEKAGSATLLRATLAQYSRARFGLIRPDGFETPLEFLDISNTHQDQLTLAEFSALRTCRLVQNLDMVAIARTVELGPKTQDANAEDNKGNVEVERNGASH